jgi:glycolate oxidase
VVVEPDAIERYSHDESGAGRFPPSAVVFPRTAEEVAEVVRFAAAEGVAVTPRGAGTGQSGGALAVQGGIVLSLERMNAIREVDAGDLVAVAEPGVILGDLQRAVLSDGLFYPPDPASLDMCTLGGNVAENAGGPRAVKYGVTRDYVLGLEAVLPTGEIVRTGRRAPKGVAGYDLTALLVGSEGTLAIVTEVTLKLLANPRRVETALLVFSDMHAAARAVTEIVRAGLTPRTLEFIDHVAIAHVRPKVPELPIPAEAGAVLLVEMDGATDAVIDDIARIDACAVAAGASSTVVAEGEAQRATLWRARRMVSPCLAEANRFKVAEDAAVPRSRVADLVAAFHRIADAAGLRACAFGHAGDGNLHLNFLFDDEAQKPLVDGAVDELFRTVIEMRGTITGEHGVGLTKRRFLPWEQSARVIELQKALKRTLDPRGILNPGKIFL